MYKRLELHNHTTESDSSITPSKLIDLMVRDSVDAFAITDHNTISGHAKIRKLLQQTNAPVSCIYGMECTTYYGHVLCLNLKEYIPFESINLHKPELLFNAAREKGALIGVAHPFSYGHPFARGCRFDMKISDFSAVDFIEIFNNPEPLHEVNGRALQWWEDLVLQGHRLAVTCGMDLHGKWEMKNQFATFIEGTAEGDIEKELETAVRNQKTWISKGPVLEAGLDGRQKSVIFNIVNTNKPGYVHLDTDPYLLAVRTQKGGILREISGDKPLELGLDTFGGEKLLIPKLYRNNPELENLISVAPVIYL